MKKKKKKCLLLKMYLKSVILKLKRNLLMNALKNTLIFVKISFNLLLLYVILLLHTKAVTPIYRR